MDEMSATTPELDAENGAHTVHPNGFPIPTYGAATMRASTRARPAIRCAVLYSSIGKVRSATAHSRTRASVHRASI
jgi:hypothetical protein